MEGKYSAGNPKGERFHGYENPSFSSTLLDAIYRSFDESTHHHHHDSVLRPSSRSRSQSLLRGHPRDNLLLSPITTVPLTKSNSSSLYRKPRESDDDLVARRRYSLPPESTKDYYAGLRSSVMSGDHRRRSLGSATTSSSGSGSSSDADFFYRASKKTNNNTATLKPIRTGVSDTYPRPPKGDIGGKSSAKSKAMKLYGDLKRMKQPISPGGKLASFLNSLFSTPKKQKTTSSESSFSTANTTPSCLSKRPSSAGRYEKRWVRFCPVSVPPRGGTTTSLRSVDEELKEKNRRVEEMARDLLRNYRQRDENMVDDEDEDVESCCSSDLFELEIGVDRYCAELPVYETTRVDTNRAIANGMIA